jgi:hypothetical protein
MFTVLKSRKLIFTDPTRGMRATPVNATVPLPLDVEAIRQALNSADPAVALAVALVAFHAVTSRQVRSLTLTDIIDGRLTLDGRDIPLASPVRVRLTAWLDYRGRTWPGSINEHLFLSRKTAPRLAPVGSQFPWKKTDLRPRLCVKTASSKRSTPPAVTPDESAISSVSRSRPPFATRSSWDTPTWKGHTSQFREPTTPNSYFGLASLAHVPRSQRVAALQKGPGPRRHLSKSSWPRL